MKHLIYQSLKIAIGVVIATFIASLLGLKYSTTAGVIALLSILDTRKQTYIVGLKRILSAVIAIILSSILFNVWGHEILVLGLFLVIFIPLGTYLKSTEGLSISTVLVTHIFTIQMLNVPIILNELSLLMIGILVAWILNLHVPNIEDDIKTCQTECERLMKQTLNNLSLQLQNRGALVNKCDTLNGLKQQIDLGLSKSIDYNNNFLLKDYSYYIEYFQMRREQYHLLRQIHKHFDTVFFTASEADELSELTLKVERNLSECSDGSEKLVAANALMDKYKNSTLPQTREEFENRAILYQYLTDLIRFINIKGDFIRKYGEIRYCAESRKRVSPR